MRRDLRDAVRSLLTSPATTISAWVSLALTVGACSALAALLNAMVFRPLPVERPEQLVVVSSGESAARAWLHTVWDEINRRHLVPEAFAWHWTRFDTAAGGERVWVDGLAVSAGTFRSLGVRPALGRLLDDGDESRNVAVISHGYWRRVYSGSPSVVGALLRLNRRQYTIVGVTAQAFTGLTPGLPFDVAIPLEPPGETPLAAPYVTVMGRLPPGRSRAELESRLRAAQPGIRAMTNPYEVSPYREEYLAEPFVVRPGSHGESFLARRYETPLQILLGAFLAVLLIACGNIAMLLAARTIGRARELAIKAAIGASRARLLKQLMYESALLAMSGCAMGLVVGQWLASFTAANLSTQAYVVSLNLSPDVRVAAFVSALAAASAIAFTIAPGLRVLRLDPLDALTPHRSGSSARSGLGSITLFGQAALSVTLLALTALFVRSFVGLASARPGFDPGRVLLVTIDSDDPVFEGQDLAGRRAQLLDAVTQLTTVESAAYSSAVPAGMTALTPWLELADGTALPQGPRGVFGNRIGPAWFHTMGSRMLTGRDLAGVAASDRARVAIVNETFARRFLGSDRAIGSVIIERAGPGEAGRRLEVVGIVEDAMYRALKEQPPPTIYTAFDTATPAGADLLVVRPRGAMDTAFTRQVVQAIATVAGQRSLTTRTLADQVGAQYSQDRLLAGVAVAFGAVATLLCAVGVFGTARYGANRRRFEIAIRLALGATPASVMALFLRRFGIIVGAGIAAGIVGARWAGHLAQSLLYQVDAHDGSAALVAVVVVSIVALAAIWWPATSAARIEPIHLLRDGQG